MFIALDEHATLFGLDHPGAMPAALGRHVDAVPPTVNGIFSPSLPVSGGVARNEPGWVT
jgi:hypothetical protein